MIVAAPLLVLGRPLVTWTWALPGGWRRRLSGGIRHPAVHAPWQAITSPIGGWLAHAGTLWVWHVPLFFESALAHPWLHEMQHASFLAGALLFWWSVIGHITPKSTAYAVLSLFTTMVHTSVLGALLTLSPALWFTSYAETAPLAGADPLQDQQLGGLIMWVPGAVAYVIGALVSGARLIFSREIRSYVDIPFSEMERRSQ
ncbi:MAG: cytochrome c oxidase caa3 assembly factor family protein [Betaproteobacteria bacterium]|nr:cytochrome c oxidase caa3 assembly factor family protein [Betaproteobacteria bacterium]